MSTNKTQNYQLNQWVKSDQVLMEEFNADNAKLDAALAALNSGKADKTALSSLQSTVTSQGTALTQRNCQVYLASHTGDGGDTPIFVFPRKPLVVIFFLSAYHGLVAVRGCDKIYAIGGDSRNFNTVSYYYYENNLYFSSGGSYVNGKNEILSVLAFLEV